jgi:[pyruvate, water dikinase]-phosphate phosphotransferase / [pyruvate, water dikinase] kinase
MTPERPVFFISDHTGITAEIIGKSLLSQFPGEAFAFTSLPFVDSLDKAQEAAEGIRRSWKISSLKPLVFSTLTDGDARAVVEASGALVMDVYGHFLGMLMGELGRPSVALRGKFHGVGDPGAYHSRIDAVNFALAADDGLGVGKYAMADLILVGVSRSGKTPTSLYMAMQYGMRIGNYPLTPENFEHPGLPASLAPHREKLRGLTLAPERLSQIRSERKPNSRYARIETCREELKAAESLMRAEGIPVIDTTHRSIEELAALLKLPLARLAAKAIQ